jgi:HSP20 family protein
MLVTRRPAARSYDPFDRAFQQLTADFFTPSSFSRRTSPTVDAEWHDGLLELTVDLPGVPKEAVSVEVADRTLTLSVEHTAKGETLRWSRSLQLGSSLDADAVSAHYADGRLTVVIPPVAAAMASRIEISDAPAAREQAAIEATATDSPADER